jgi:hypothetical protein
MAFRGMNLAARSIFIVDKKGKLALVERRFAVPKALAQTPIPGKLEELVDADIRRACGKLEPEPEARITLLRALDAVVRADAEGLGALLLPDAGLEAGALLGLLGTLPEPRPSVFDLADPARIEIQADKAGHVEASVPLRLEKPSRLVASLKKTDAGWRIQVLTRR